MFRASFNHVAIHFELEPLGPILVRSGKAGHDPLHPDVSAIRARHAQGETVYLPGSGLKGVVRAQFERILRASDQFVCDPFDAKSQCRQVRGIAPAGVYQASCGACRTFGSTSVAGRMRIGDAYPTPDTWAEANRTEVRNGVGINRTTQASAPGVLYDMEVVTRGRFAARLDLENFELWQLALVLQVLADLDAGIVQVGGMKSRGLGAVRLVDLRLAYESTRGGSALRGVSSWMGDTSAEWGLHAEPEITADYIRQAAAGLRPRLEIPDKASALALLDQLAAEVWPAYLRRRQ